MSYARFGPDSDVYVFLHYAGHLECCGCTLAEYAPYESMFGPALEQVDPRESAFASTTAMIDHLARHRAAGHTVPDGIEDTLRDDDATNFPTR